MKGLIIVGYQGIGKSSCAGKENCIDLESGNFFVGEKRSPDWYMPYCQIAMNLADQGYTVFTSSHAVVYEQFASMPILQNVGNIVVFCPRQNMKDEWIARLAFRYDKTKLWKDAKALENAIARYTDNIQELFNSGLPIYQPEAMDYDLMDYVHKIRKDWC
jgi:hypothetical protein